MHKSMKVGDLIKRKGVWKSCLDKDIPEPYGIVLEINLTGFVLVNWHGYQDNSWERPHNLEAANESR